MRFLAKIVGGSLTFARQKEMARRLVEDVNIALGALGDVRDRSRRWIV